MTSRRETEEIVRRVRKLDGWDVVAGRHFKFLHHGRLVAVSSRTPSDHRSIKNLLALLRRKGCPL